MHSRDGRGGFTNDYGHSCSEKRGIAMIGKRVQFDDETWQALDVLAHDRMSTFQELADEAFRDLLNKHGRPTDFKTALRQSLEREKPDSPPPCNRSNRASPRPAPARRIRSRP